MRAVNMTWRGVDYIIPANKAFDVGADIEEIMTMADIAHWQVRPKLRKLAKAYGAMLRFAGCKVADVTVFDDMMSVQEDAGGQVPVFAALAALAELLTGGAPEVEGDMPEKTSAS